MYSRLYKLAISLPPLAWVILFLLVPYGLMFAHSFWLTQDGVILHRWNLHQYAEPDANKYTIGNENPDQHSNSHGHSHALSVGRAQCLHRF